MKILIINCPNLNLLGIREKEIYGSETFEDYLEKLRNNYKNIIIEYYHSNVEGELINKIHEVGFSYDGILINAGGYTHTSVAIADAIGGVNTPVVEIHMSNILKREEFRHKSLIASKCAGSIMGFGLESYKLGIESFFRL